MLIALLRAFLLGGGGGVAGAILTSASVQEIAKEVRKTVSDPAREATAVEALTELKKTIKTFEKDFDRSGKVLSKLYRDHAAGAEPMLEVLEELNASWEEAQKHAVERRFRLRDSLTEKEWKEVFGVE